jgi:hypothetical protein
VGGKNQQKIKTENKTQGNERTKISTYSAEYKLKERRQNSIALIVNPFLCFSFKLKQW